MVQAFINIGILDIVDIFVVAFLMYQAYLLIRGTNAINIFIGIAAIYLLWLIVRALNMQMLSTILGQIIGVGVIALIIVFQQEIRRFLLVMGSRYFSKKNFSIEKILLGKHKNIHRVDYEPLVDLCFDFSRQKTGALIVLGRKTDLNIFAETGDILNSNLSPRLIESIFYKQGPLHDGAILIKDETIIAARCVLPISDKRNLPPWMGMRHKAALGMSENSDAIVLIISEEKGFVSLAVEGNIERNLTKKRLLERLEVELNET